MKKTPKKIVINALDLFNKKGVSNVRIQDIASNCEISSGNLSYHFKTKRELIISVLDLMKEQSEKLRGHLLIDVKKEDYTSVLRKYISFQIAHRFFYRDILDVVKIVPEAKDLFERSMKEVITFIKKGMAIAIDKGIILPEPHPGHFHYVAKNIWAILNSWLAEREVLGEDKVSLEEVMLAIWEYHYPYLTKAGKAKLQTMKRPLYESIKKEAMT
jgi:AcrR family transcriptional regulator